MEFTEETYEQLLIERFENMGYSHICGYGIDRDFRKPFYEDELRSSLQRLNPNLSPSIIDSAVDKLTDIPSGTLEDINEKCLGYIQNGLEIGIFHDGESDTEIVNLIDYENISNNSFVCANQWTVIGNTKDGIHECRPDIVLFVNGLPLVLIELKSPSRSQTDASEGYIQIQRYKKEIPNFFAYNQICVISDMAISKAGTITSNEARFMEWKTVDGNYESTLHADFKTFFDGMFQKDRLIDIVRNFICFSNEGIRKFKILAAYHQYFAVHKALDSTIKGIQSDGKGGVFWHTQGSGKSLSMVFYAHLLISAVSNITLVVITDRNDLDDQLFGQFIKCQSFLRQNPIQATTQENLRTLLLNRQANGIFFTTMGKFLDPVTPFTDRKNIVVMADEAHRSQYGLIEKTKLVKNAEGHDEVKIAIGAARRVRKSLPNATYIGFTGTPVSSKDHNTTEVFGNYIDVYDMTQAVEDGATRPVYYESRVVKLKLDEDTLRKIDNEYDLLAEEAENTEIENTKRKMAGLDAILSNDSTINSLVDDILDHYQNTREHLLTGKALIVAYDRKCAMKIYNKILSIHPDWSDKVKVVMTESKKDPIEWHDIIGNKKYREKLAIAFKDDESEFKIAIVVDMWLTGFDVPSLATMYVYKPMNGHNLMQAIARVNRVFRDKEGGLVVDYIGIANALKHAMSDYTNRDKKNYGDLDINKQAYPKFQEKLWICKDLLYGCDYKGFFSGNNSKMANAILNTVNFLMNPEKKVIKDDFIKQALLAKNFLSLCASIATETERYEESFIETVRVTIIRIENPRNGKTYLIEINNRINDLIQHSIKSDGVINLFKDTGDTYSIFNPSFLNEIKNMKHTNIAVEILKKLIEEQIKTYKRTNIVQSEKFSEIMQRSLNSYLNGMITSQEVIDELLKMAKEIKATQDESNSLNLSTEEKAFYDALSRPQAVKDFYSNDELIALTRELTETLRERRTVDWNKKTTARARMRVLVRMLLKKYKYPPKDADDAESIVIAQCELWADNTDDYYPMVAESAPQYIR